MHPIKHAAGLAAMLAWSLAAQAQATFNLDDLLAMTARQTQVQTTFTEKKFIKGLEAPIESSGELSFEAPVRMVKRTLAPRPETLRLEGRMVTLERGRQTRTLSLDDYPELAVHVEGIRASLAGDRSELERVYRAELTGTATQWKMTLTPLNEKAAAQVKTVLLTGEQADIRSVQVLLTDGDSSVMTIARPKAH
jgi:outer membrane lipoprotein-sorting protein